MDSDKTLYKNLSFWAHLHPKEAIWLQYVDSDHLKFCKTEENELNLVDKKRYLHDQKGALKEAISWFSKLSIPDIDVLYIYGIGLGYYYDAARKWLKEKAERHIVFLEDDLAKVSKFFETKKATTILKDKQVLIYYFSDIEQSEPVFNKIFWNFPLKKFECFALQHYIETKKSKYLQLRHNIFHNFETKRAGLIEYINCGSDFFENYYANLFHLSKAVRGDRFFGKFKGVPAIICGAGPSLKKSLPYLKELKNRALIFAGSSAIPALDNSSIKPHFGVGIDPFPGQKVRLRNVNLNFPFFYRGRFLSSALDLIKGAKLFLPGSVGYEISSWFEKKFKLEGPEFEEGRNVVTFSLEIANLMGCNPIIFVGMDLAFTDNLQYSEGVITNNSFDKNMETEKVLQRADIYGNKVQTLWKWLAESEWVADFAVNNKDKVLINATMGGIGFLDVANKSLKTVAKKYLQKRFNIDKRIETLVKKSKVSISKKRILSAVDEMQNSLKRCVKYLDEMLKENRKAKKQKQLPKAPSALAMYQLEEEIAYKYILHTFNLVANFYVERKLDKLSQPHLNTDNEKKGDLLLLNEMKFSFLKEVATVNIKLIDKAKKQHCL